MKKPQIPQDVLNFFRKTGKMGGEARVKRHTAEELSEWGKLGGRPKGSGKKQASKATTKKGGK